MQWTIREMSKEDLEAAAWVHQSAFVRQKDSLDWISSNFNAKPKTLSYVALVDARCVGYVIWSQKAGFRTDAVVELEQIGVTPSHQGRGIGEALIKTTLPLLSRELGKQGASLKSVLVTTRADNQAQKLYQRVLGAEIEATISGLYSADEVIMVARDIAARSSSWG